MCLIIEIRVPGIAHERAGEVSRQVSKTPGMLKLFSQRQQDQSKGALFKIGPDPSEQCACGLMGEAFEETSAEFDLNRDECESLAKSLEFIAGAAGVKGFYLRAGYVSGPWVAPNVRATIQLPKLLGKIRDGRLPSGLDLHVRPVA